MKIILLKESWPGHGQTLSLRLGRWHLLGVALLLVSLLLVTSHLVAAYLPALAFEDAPTQQLRQRLMEQDAEIATLRQRSAAKSEAVGRQLAAMQARLMRMEALGARVVGAAGLDHDEFAFDDPVPLGGPTDVAFGVLDWPELEAAALGLSQQINRRAGQLDVLESLLRDREFQQSTVVAGRPVSSGWMSSAFGKRVDPFSGRMAWHRGVDFAGREGAD
ncbi:MAG: M23 family metallopeptidase, partial [Pseudomonadales bacterium]